MAESVFCYCTLNELIADLKGQTGLPADTLERFILPASDYITREIGQFIPLIEQRKFRGSGRVHMHLPPLMSISAIVNASDTLVAADYILGANEQNKPAWGNGPYLRIEFDPASSKYSTWYDYPNGVQITAHWGVYEQTAVTGATVQNNPQNAGDLTLVVNDGSLIGPGMHLAIESEMEFITGYGAVTAAVTTLNGAIDASQEIIILANGSLVKAGEIISVEFEQMKVLEIQTNNVAVARGWNNTKKVSHLTGANVGAYRTFSVKRGLNGTTAAGHIQNTVISKYIVPGDINLLARKIASLMYSQALTGFSGRGGSAESGDSFWINIYPRDDIDRLRSNYDIPVVR
jgi:hypothetical protein